MKKILTALALFSLLLMLFLAACSKESVPNSNQEDTAAAAPMAMTIGAMPSVDKIPIIVGNSLGFFEKYGLSVELVSFQSPVDRNAALQAGEIQGVMSDMVAHLLYLEAGMEMVMTSLIQTDFMVVASSQSGITTFGQISKDHCVGIALNTLMEYVAEAAGPAQKVMVADVMTRVEQVAAGSLDLTVVPEPYGSMALDRGAVAVGSAEDLDIYAAVMLFPRDYIAAHGQALTAFYRGYNDAVDYLETKGINTLLPEIIAEGEFPATAETILGNLTFRPIAPAEATQFSSIQSWMQQHSQFQGSYNYQFAEISDFSFLP